MIKMKTIKLFFILLICWSCNDDDNGKKGTTSNKLMVEVVNPTKHVYKSKISITGNLEANQQVIIYAMESGFVSSIQKDIGDEVKKGEIIAQLENPQLLEQWKSAVADYDNKNAHYNRLKKLYKQSPDLTTIQDLEIALAAFKQAEAKRDASKTRIGFLSIGAPFSGIITERLVDQGAVVQTAIDNSNASALVVLKEVKKLRLIVYFPAVDIGRIQIGTLASLTFPEIPEEKRTANISRMSNNVDENTKTMRVEFDIDNEDFLLKPGMHAKIQIDLTASDKALSLPVEALAVIKNQEIIYRITKGKVEQLAIRPGLTDKFYMEILDPPLSAEDLIVVTGKKLISPGMKVEVQLKQ